MTSLRRTLSSTIGVKFGMALTGVLLALFVVGHLLGNLLVFKGRTAMNDYAEMLKGLGPWLYVIRLGLLAVFLAHVSCGLLLWCRNAAARPVAYQKPSTQVATLASRTMVMTGLLVLAFVLMHLMHFTLGWLEPAKYALHEDVVRDGVTVARHDVYGMLVAGFHNSGFVVLYALAVLVLGFHLSHGLSSVFQSLGLRHPNRERALRIGGCTIAWVLALAYLTIPLAVRLGFVGTEAASR